MDSINIISIFIQYNIGLLRKDIFLSSVDAVGGDGVILLEKSGGWGWKLYSCSKGEENDDFVRVGNKTAKKTLKVRPRD